MGPENEQGIASRMLGFRHTQPTPECRQNPMIVFGKDANGEYIPKWGCCGEPVVLEAREEKGDEGTA